METPRKTPKMENGNRNGKGTAEVKSFIFGMMIFDFLTESFWAPVIRVPCVVRDNATLHFFESENISLEQREETFSEENFSRQRRRNFEIHLRLHWNAPMIEDRYPKLSLAAIFFGRRSCR